MKTGYRRYAQNRSGNANFVLQRLLRFSMSQENQHLKMTSHKKMKENKEIL